MARRLFRDRLASAARYSCNSPALPRRALSFAILTNFFAAGRSWSATRDADVESELR
jgi:hypothetical protein